MISNLNQLSFQTYGIIESERVRGRDLALKAERCQVRELVRGECPVMVSQSEEEYSQMKWNKTKPHFVINTSSIMDMT